MNLLDFFKKEKNAFSKNIKKIIKSRELVFFDDIYRKCLCKYEFDIDELAFFYEKNTCINCGSVLDISVKSSKNCPECKNKIIIKTDVYSKKKIMISQDMIKMYDNYDKEVREILFMEREMNKKNAIYKDYMNKFYYLKQNGNSNARDIMYQFVNYVGSELEQKAYKEYMTASKLSFQDKSLKYFDAILNFKKANQEYKTLYNICMFEKKYNVAICLLTDIVYRDIQILILDIESNLHYKHSSQDILNMINVNLIVDLINKSHYSFDELKKIFIEQRHPFIIPKISNEESWKYVELAMNKFKKNL